MKTRFIPVAVDQHIHRRLRNDEGALFAHVLQQAGRGLDGRSQGVYIFSPDGILLSFANTADAGRVKQLIATAFEKFDPETVSEIERPQEQLSPLPVLPPGGVVVDVASKILDGYDPDDPRSERLARSIGRDHLWITQEEVDALKKSQLPASLQFRLARFHLIDNTRGEPPMWSRNEVKQLVFTLNGGELRGSVHLETASGDRGYEADIFGRIETGAGGLTRFDLIVLGKFWGEGTYTRGAPQGKFPLAIAFSLSDPDDPIAKVPPQAARLGTRGYLP